jgi:hypothetical protein
MRDAKRCARTRLPVARLCRRKTPGVEPTIIDVSVQKRPDADDWVRVHPGKDFQRTVTLLEHKRRIYLLTASVADTLPPEEYFCATLYLAITRENEPFLWYVKEKPDAGHDWFHSAAECVAAAMKGFIRVRTGTKGYKCANIRVALPEPKWPKESFKQILKLAFKDWLIDKPDHMPLPRLIVLLLPASTTSLPLPSVIVSFDPAITASMPFPALMVWFCNRLPSRSTEPFPDVRA